MHLTRCLSTRLLVGVTAVAVPVGLVAPSAAAAPAKVVPAKAAPADRTSAREAKRVDSVPTPELDWYPCYDHAECATVNLPLDYDQPKGAKVQIAILRVKARDQKHKIGSLFVNPGGRGGPGTGVRGAERGTGAQAAAAGGGADAVTG